MNTDHPDDSTLLVRIPRCTEEFTRTENEASDKYLPIKERLTALRRKLNETAPIAQLPAEVLGAIFHSYVLDHWDLYLSQTKDSPTSAVTPYSWFAILHICHHWRQVALSNPALWTYVVPTNDQCVEFVLSKSGSLPLTAWSSNDEESRMVESSTGIRLPRIRTAKFRVHPMSGFQWTVSLFEKSKVAADMLEELCLETGPDMLSKDVFVFGSGAMQGLRSLRIIGGTLALTQFLLRSSLTTLDATLARVMLTASALDEFIVALSQLPLLQRMTLRSLNWMPRTALPNVLPPPQHIATVPQLKHISLEGPALGLAELIHCLVFPSDAVIRLHSAPGGSMEESQLALSSLLPKVIGSAVLNPENGISSPRGRPRSLLLDRDTLEISLWRTVQSWPLNEDETHSSEEPDLHMFIPFDTNDELVVAELMAALDLTEVITIQLRLGLSTAAWTRIFEHLALPKLESIRIFNEVNAETFLVAMATRLTQPQPTVEANGDAASSYYLFPDLKRLELDTVMCHEGWRCGPSVRDFFHTMTTSLQLRAERVRKLEQLLLIRPINLLPSDYQALDSGSYAECYEVHNPIMDESEDETCTPGTDAEDGEDGASLQESDWDDPDLEC